MFSGLQIDSTNIHQFRIKTNITVRWIPFTVGASLWAYTDGTFIRFDNTSGRSVTLIDFAKAILDDPDLQNVFLLFETYLDMFFLITPAILPADADEPSSYLAVYFSNLTSFERSREDVTQL